MVRVGGGVCRCIPRVLVFVAEMRSEWAWRLAPTVDDTKKDKLTD